MLEKTFEGGGFVRLSQIIGDPPGTGPIPISRSLWYQMVADGRAPRSVKIGRRAVAWRTDEVNKLISSLSESSELAD